MTFKPEYICLLELIKASLFQTVPQIPSNVNWDIVFELAKKQCIVPLIEPFVPDSYRDSWTRISIQNKAHYIQLIYEQNELIQLFENNNIPIVILKGTSVSRYYPNPSLRSMGDIDFYILKDFFPHAESLMIKNNYRFINSTDRHNIYTKNGIEFEMHFRYSCQYYNNIDSYLIESMKTLDIYSINGYNFYSFPVNENGLILLGHLMQHLSGSGLGFRQILDWMMFVNHALDDDLWNNSFKKIASDSGLEKLAITTTKLCQNYLGLKNDISWCNDADDKLSEQLLERVFIDGNFGVERSIFEDINKRMKVEGKFHYLQKAGLYNWNAAKKYKFLKPFAWFYQLTRYTVKTFSYLFNRKRLFSKEKSSSNLGELIKNLK